MPPGPFMSRDTLYGMFVPPLSLFGGFRPLAFVDTAEPRHETLIKLVLHLVAARKQHVIPAFHTAFNAMFDVLDASIAASGSAEYKLNQSGMLDFTRSALLGGVLPSAAIGPTVAAKTMKWLLSQLHPLVAKVGMAPWPLEDLLLHTFHLPACLVRRDYAALNTYISTVASSVLDEAETDFSIPRDEALHNVIFVAVFNAYGGFKIFLPYLLKWLTVAGAPLHAKLADEARAAMAHENGELTVSGLERMTLVKSVVWEALRMNPPVEFQYGRAREDLIIVESHDAAYEVKKNELLFGYQPFATRDERVFEKGGEFMPEQFTTEEGRQLLKYVVWSNGPETGEPGTADKECPWKDMVVMVAEMFLRYDTFAADVGDMPPEPNGQGDQVNV